MKINHQPLYDYRIAEDYYTKKDGVPIKYVCTTSLGHETVAGDIFYRETPHPEFGNRYFRIFRHDEVIFIDEADRVEDLYFGMLEVGGEYYYSRHRHDFVAVGSEFIDGGRDYVRSSYLANVVYFKVKDGQFIQAD